MRVRGYGIVLRRIMSEVGSLVWPPLAEPADLVHEYLLSGRNEGTDTNVPWYCRPRACCGGFANEVVN